MDFSVNFLERATVVLKEAALLKKYKAMPLALAILVGIFMLPLVLASVLLAIPLYVFGYLFSVVSLPVQSLHKLLREEGQNIKHGAQIVVYLLSWSFIFGAYAMLTFFLVSLTVLYSVFSIFTYLWTLGGFKFHLFAKDEDISVNVEGTYKPIIPAIFLAIMGVLLVVVPLIETFSFISEIKIDVNFDMFLEIFKMEMHKTDALRFLVSALYSAILFAPGPKKIEE
jgi:hypothetical protein